MIQKKDKPKQTEKSVEQEQITPKTEEIVPSESNDTEQ